MRAVSQMPPEFVIVVGSLPLETCEMGQSFPFQDKNTEYKTLFNKDNKDENDIKPTEVKSKIRSRQKGVWKR